MKNIKTFEKYKESDVDDILHQIELFLDSTTRNLWIGNKSIKIYIRKSKRIFKGIFYDFVDFASIEVYKTGQGLFTQILNRFEEKYPDKNIFIESVLTERFSEYIKNILGFEEEYPNVSKNYYKVKSI